MKVLSMHETNFSPKIVFDYEKGLLDIRGKSLPDDAYAFYEPLIQWVEDYGKNPKSKTIVNIQFAYFNTSSSKNILELFKRLALIKEAGYDVEINWIYDVEEEDILEAGEDYQAIVKIPFNLVGFKRS